MRGCYWANQQNISAKHFRVTDISLWLRKTFPEVPWRLAEYVCEAFEILASASIRVNRLAISAGLLLFKAYVREQLSKYLY